MLRRPDRDGGGSPFGGAASLPAIRGFKRDFVISQTWISQGIQGNWKHGSSMARYPIAIVNNTDSRFAAYLLNNRLTVQCPRHVSSRIDNVSAGVWTSILSLLSVASPTFSETGKGRSGAAGSNTFELVAVLALRSDALTHPTG